MRIGAIADASHLSDSVMCKACILNKRYITHTVFPLSSAEFAIYIFFLYFTAPPLFGSLSLWPVDGWQFTATSFLLFHYGCLSLVQWQSLRRSDGPCRALCATQNEEKRFCPRIYYNDFRKCEWMSVRTVLALHRASALFATYVVVGGNGDGGGGDSVPTDIIQLVAQNIFCSVLFRFILLLLLLLLPFPLLHFH